MKPGLLASAVAFSLSLSIGQVLLKLAAEDVKSRLAISWLGVFQSVWLVSALILYALTTVLWLWLLAQLPLSKAYPFALFGAALVPVIAALVLHEPIGAHYAIGMALMICGIAIIHLSGQA